MDEEFKLDIFEPEMDPFFTDFSEDDYIRLFKKYTEKYDSYLLIVDVEPYIRALYFRKYPDVNNCFKFAFVDNWKWNSWSEGNLCECCVIDPPEFADTRYHMDIYKKYSAEHPEWHLKPYYNSFVKLLFHIHHCQVKGTCEELLFKAGLDALAREMFYIDKPINSASTPSEIFDYVPLRVLKALNSDKGADLLIYFNHRELLTRFNKIYPNWFNHELTEYECEHLKTLMDKCIKYEEENEGIDIPLSEVKKCNSKGKKLDSLLDVRIKQLISKSLSYRDMMLWELKNYKSNNAILKKYLGKISNKNERMMETLHLYLIKKHKHYSKLFRIRRRDKSKYCEEHDGYIVSLPKTVDDYCAEAVYQNNCLFNLITYYAKGISTILFIRKKESSNIPYITFEVCQGELFQAYYKNNKELSKEDTNWIIEYCKRHNIKINYYFVSGLDGVKKLL